MVALNMTGHPMQPRFHGKLGKLAAKPVPRGLNFLSYLAASPLPLPPAKRSWMNRARVWPMMANDTVGDCTCAGAGHMIEAWTSQTRPTPTLLSDAVILATYTAVTAAENGGHGYDPHQTQPDGSNPTDTGAALADVIDLWHRVGIGGHKIDGSASVKPSHLVPVKQAINIFGGLYCGVQLPITAQSQHVWDIPVGGLSGDGKPGSWGGHCVPVLEYDPDGLTCISWGQEVRMTWRFFASYFDEAHALISPDLKLPDSKTPEGELYAKLAADAQAL